MRRHAKGLHVSTQLGDSIFRGLIVPVYSSMLSSSLPAYQVITQYGSTVYRLLWFISIKPILKENSDLTFSFKLFPFLVTSMSKTNKKE